MGHVISSLVIARSMRNLIADGSIYIYIKSFDMMNIHS